MTSIIDSSPLFDLRTETSVSATPEEIYAVVSDLGRSAEWSPECLGGEWISGTRSTVGAIFRGENLRADDVVAWAPLVRGIWYTDCRIVAAEPGRTFRWMMLTHAMEDQESIWGFDIEPMGPDGCKLIHHFRMNQATAGIHKIVADLDEAGRGQFVDDWTAKLAQDLIDTVKRIKDVIESR